MPVPLSARTHATRLIASLAVSFAFAGCSHHTTAPKVVAPDPSPQATSAEMAVKRFEWCWQNRDIDRYSGLLTADFVEVPAAADSSAKDGPQPWTRDPELAAIRHVFVPGTGNMIVSKITLSFDRTLFAFPDSLDLSDPLRKYVRTHVDLEVVLDHGDGSMETGQIQGFAGFHLVRGDRANLPAQAARAGGAQDSTHWWVQRVDDQTLDGGFGYRALPTKSQSWHWLRVRAL